MPVVPVEQVTGFPECLDGRVKTLHPAVHAGLLADSRRPEHLAQIEDLGIAAFDLVVVNLYPFAATVASGAAPDEVVEQIDIGGPAMVRSSAKNHPTVAVVVDPARYDEVLDAVDGGGFTLAQRTALAAAAFAHTAAYDTAVATWFAEQVAGQADAPGTDAQAEDGPAAPAFAGTTGRLVSTLRYGENPHQRAAVYATGERAGLAGATQLHGKAMSYNNFVDTDAAVRAAGDHDAPAVAIIKHANPCGIAVASPGAADPVADAHARAHACDPVSAFGGVVAANRPVTRAMAEQLADVFTEVVAAPAFDEDALAVLTAQEERPPARRRARPARRRPRRSGAGSTAACSCSRSTSSTPPATPRPAGPSRRAPPWTRPGWRTWSSRGARSGRSSPTRSCSPATAPRSGIGMGQVNRVDSCRLAVERAGAERAAGSVAASDAFFPFADGVQVLLDAGVRAVVQPGGSVRDAEVVAAVEAAGATMYLTGVRHFAH